MMMEVVGACEQSSTIPLRSMRCALLVSKGRLAEYILHHYAHGDVCDPGRPPAEGCALTTQLMLVDRIAVNTHHIRINLGPVRSLRVVPSLSLNGETVSVAVTKRKPATYHLTSSSSLLAQQASEAAFAVMQKQLGSRKGDGRRYRDHHRGIRRQLRDSASSAV